MSSRFYVFCDVRVLEANVSSHAPDDTVKKNNVPGRIIIYHCIFARVANDGAQLYSLKCQSRQLVIIFVTCVFSFTVSRLRCNGSRLLLFMRRIKI